MPENLEVDNSSPEKFFDKKYNIRFPHDIHTSFAEDLPSIKAKYKRRIERFIDEEHKGTCFIRAINDPAEIDFIAENREKINSTLTKLMILATSGQRSYNIRTSIPEISGHGFL